MAVLRPSTWFRRSPVPRERPVVTLLPSLQPPARPIAPSAERHNDCALALYERLRHEPGNVFFSPFSIRAALMMALAGAVGETEAELRRVLRVPSSDESAHEAVAALISRLRAAAGGAYSLAVANGLWSQEGAPLQVPFLDLVDRHYGAALHTADFRGDAAGARVRINDWVEDATNQNIRDLIPPGGLSADTRLVLANAAWFTGKWTLPFPNDETHHDRFYLDGGGTVMAPLMRVRAVMPYWQGDGIQAVDLGYRGDDLSMLALVPDRKDGAKDLERKLSPQVLTGCTAGLIRREVRLFLPRFTVTWGSVGLRDHLTAMGMPRAFVRGEADFSGINGLEPPHDESLFISDVYHKAFVDVNEDGAEAAAATALITDAVRAPLKRATPPPIPIVRADRPFLFAIRDVKSGALLFLGRMSDPTRGSSAL